MKGLRVIHVLPHGEKAGMEKGVLAVVNGLAARGVCSAISILAEGNDLADHVAALDIKFWNVPKIKDGLDWTLCLKLSRLLKRERPHILHTHNWGTFLYGAVAGSLAGVPRLVHGEHGYSVTNAGEEPRSRLLMGRLLSLKVDAFVAVTGEIARRMERKWNVRPERITTILNGVDDSVFRPAAEGESARIRQGLGLHASDEIVGTVGRLDPIKNQGALLRALAELSPRVPGKERLRCLVVGQGPEEAKLKALANELGIADRVIFTGHRGDVNVLLRAMDIFVLPSHAEGCSNTLLEAMASGTPVLASEIPGNLELIVPGRTALVFTPDDHTGLAGLMERCLNDAALRQSLSRAGIEHVRERFTMEAMLTAYERFYLSVASGLAL